MTSVISRGPTPVSSQLPMAGEAIATANQPTSVGDHFAGVIAGDALQATLASGSAAASLQLNSEARAQLSAAVAAIASGNTPGAVTAVATATRAQGITTYNDVNALVQQVLREAYIQNTEDLRMFAEKVKFFNAVKETLRNELSRARESLTNAIEANPGVSSDEHMSLREPFLPTSVDTTFRGGTDVSVSDAYKAFDGRTADAAFTTGEFGGNWTTTSGQRWDPLAVDLNRDGRVETIDAAGGVFDLGSRTESRTRVDGSAIGDVQASGSGARTRWSDEREVTTRFTEWFGPAEGIVVLDRNGDGRIQGQDLFGDEQVTGRNVANGYEDLALLDSNNDGTFDFRDERFHEVQIWQDANSDGIAQEGEMSSLFQNGISSLDLRATAGAVAGEDSAVIREGSEFRALDGAIFSREQLENYISTTEDQLNTVGDDAQLANVDLQNMLQKQQQTLQMMSNISKSLHDTAMSVIRKIGG